MPVPGLQLFYGGTFDPVHNGHLAIACAARDELSCVVQLMPAADPPHRAAPGADAAQRAQMLELAVAGRARFARGPARAGPRWPLLQHRYPARVACSNWAPTAPIALLIGADSFVGLPSWHEWERAVRFQPISWWRRVPAVRWTAHCRSDLAATAQGRWTESPARPRQHAAAGRLVPAGASRCNRNRPAKCVAASPTAKPGRTWCQPPWPRASSPSPVSGRARVPAA